MLFLSPKDPFFHARLNLTSIFTPCPFYYNIHDVWIYLTFLRHAHSIIIETLDCRVCPFQVHYPKCIPFEYTSLPKIQQFSLIISILFSNPDYNLLQGTGILTVQKLFGNAFLMCTASLLSWPSLTKQDDAVNIIEM